MFINSWRVTPPKSTPLSQDTKHTCLVIYLGDDGFGELLRTCTRKPKLVSSMAHVTEESLSSVFAEAPKSPLLALDLQDSPSTISPLMIQKPHSSPSLPTSSSCHTHTKLPRNTVLELGCELAKRLSQRQAVPRPSQDATKPCMTALNGQSSQDNDILYSCLRWSGKVSGKSCFDPLVLG